MKLVTKARSHPPCEHESGMRPGTFVVKHCESMGIFAVLKSRAEKSTNHETDQL